MRLKLTKLGYSKKAKPFRWRMWLLGERVHFSVSGPLGVIYDSFPINGVVLQGKELFFYDGATYNSFIGRLFGIINGICFGFFVDMFYKGLGYRAWVSGRRLYSVLGYSHLLEYDIPEGLFIKARKNHLFLFSSHKIMLTDVAQNLCKLKVPDPYRGKGVRFVDEDFFIKPGKQR